MAAAGVKVHRFEVLSAGGLVIQISSWLMSAAGYIEKNGRHQKASALQLQIDA